MKRIHLLKPGTFVAKDGTQHRFTAADLAEIALGYNAELSEAPIVIGHPKDNAPAFGWIKKVTADAGGLYAEPDELQPAFAEMVKKGLFKKISAAIFSADHPSNPTPGKRYLRHVGFLGAQPPAIKGLEAVQFAGTEAGCVTIEFADWDDVRIATMFRSLRDWLISQFGLDAANKALPDADVSGALLDAALEDDEPGSTESPSAPPGIPNATFSESQRRRHAPATTETTVTDAAKEAKFAERETQLTAREQKLAKEEATRRRASMAEFVEGLVKAGKILPRDRSFVIELGCALPAEGTIEFAEVEGQAAQKVNTVERLKKYLSGLGKQIELSERAAGAVVAGQLAEFTAPPGTTVDTVGLETLGKAREFQRLHPNTDLVAAVKAVSAA
jgi:hypothetical protein